MAKIQWGKPNFMVPKRSGLKKEGYLYAFLYGLLTGILLCVISLIAWRFEYKIYEPYLWVHTVALFGCMVWAAVYYRQQHENILALREAYLFCVTLGLSAALVFFFYAWLIQPLMVSGFVDGYMAHQYELVNNLSDISDAEKTSQLEWIKNATPLIIAVRVFCEMAILSVFIPLLLSLFLKKEK